jgi:ADP-ribose pyrophosphatase YjhB (NUDIX family)
MMPQEAFMKYRFCPNCATPLESELRGGRHRPVCPACGFVRYANPVAGVAGIILLPGRHKLAWERDVAVYRGADAGPGPPDAGAAVPDADPAETAMPAPGGPPLILLARRTIPPAGWCIPCGYVESDEEIRAALIREMLEETGLEIEPREVFAVQSNFHNPETPTVGTWFITRVIGGRAEAGDDVDRLGLYPVTRPPALAFPTDQVVLERLALGSGG